METVTRVAMINTKDCNMDCSYCYEKIREKKYMSKKIVKDAIDFLLPLMGKELRFAWIGGETLLNFEAVKYGAECLKGVPNTFHSIATNCTIWNKEIEDFVLKNENFIIKGSWNGLSEYQDRTGELSKLVEKNIKRIAKLIPNRLSIMSIILPGNVDNIYNSFEYMSQTVSPEKIIVRPVFETPGWTNEKLNTLNEQVYRIMKDFIGKKVDLSVRQPYRRYSCGLGKLGYGIGVEGDLYPCFRAYFIKNAHELKLGDIYNGENITNKAFLDLRYSKENSCTNCDISDFCEQCPVLTYETTGSFIKHNNEHCMPARAYVLGIQRAMLDAVIEKGVKRC